MCQSQQAWTWGLCTDPKGLASLADFQILCCVCGRAPRVQHPGGDNLRPLRPTYLPAAAAVVFPADDGEGRFARGTEATGLVWDPLGRVCDNKSGGHIRQGSHAGVPVGAGGRVRGLRWYMRRNLWSGGPSGPALLVSTPPGTHHWLWFGKLATSHGWELCSCGQCPLIRAQQQPVPPPGLRTWAGVSI